MDSFLTDIGLWDVMYALTTATLIWFTGRDMLIYGQRFYDGYPFMDERAEEMLMLEFVSRAFGMVFIFLIFAGLTAWQVRGGLPKQGAIFLAVALIMLPACKMVYDWSRARFAALS